MVKYCEKCGAKLDDDAAFCDECGKSINGQIKNASQSKGNNKLYIGLVILIIVVIGAVVCALVMSDSLEAKKTVEFEAGTLTIPESWNLVNDSTLSMGHYISYDIHNGDGESKGGITVWGSDFGDLTESKAREYFAGGANLDGKITKETINGFTGFKNEKDGSTSFIFKDKTNGCVYVIYGDIDKIVGGLKVNPNFNIIQQYDFFGFPSYSDIIT